MAYIIKRIIKYCGSHVAPSNRFVVLAIPTPGLSWLIPSGYPGYHLHRLIVIPNILGIPDRVSSGVLSVILRYPG
jgi:hypothetical protein